MNEPPEPVPCVRGTEQIDPTPSVVTIGNFDGVHRGHQVLLRRTVDAATARGLRSVAVTFDPPPMALLRPELAPPLLQTVDERCHQLRAAGADLVLVLPFTRELAALTPAAFVERVLAGPLQARRVVVGTNFRFGHRAAGNVVTLVEEGEQHGFEVEAVTLLELGGVTISSSAVREHLQAGDVGWVGLALGRPPRIAGTVVRGDARGRAIGFPTANLDVPNGLVLPADGVYAGYAELAGARHPAVVNVGVRPTFDGQRRTVEAHLLDLDLDLYGRQLGLALEYRIRGERRFDGVEALVAQIAVDAARSRELLA